MINNYLDHSATSYKLCETKDDTAAALIKHTHDGNLKELQKLHLLEHKFDVLDEKQNSLLHIATKKRHKLIVEFLLNIKEINPKLPNKKGLSALHIASRDGQDEIIPILLKHIDINIRGSFDFDGATPLIMAAWKGHSNTAKLLLENGADDSLPSSEGYTPLHNASNSKNIDIVYALLKSSSATINYQAKSGSTALMIAAQKGCDNIVELLLKYGANPYIVNVRGSTALICAINKGYKSTALILRKSSLELKEHASEYFSRKLLAHVFQIGGTSKLLSPPQLISRTELFIDLEGIHGTFTWPKMAKYTNRCIQMVPEPLNKIWATISDIFSDKTTPYSTPSSLLERYKSKKPIIVLTGFIEHMALVIIWNNYIVICDTGGFLKEIIQLYHIDSTAVTQTLIDDLQNLIYKTEDEFIEFCETKIPGASPTEKNDLEGLQKYLNFPKQRGGHCTVVSIQAAVFGFLMLGYTFDVLHTAKAPTTPKMLKQIRAKSLQEFSVWHTFIQTHLLEKYKSKTSSLYPKDEELIKKCELLVSKAPKGV